MTDNEVIFYVALAVVGLMTIGVITSAVLEAMRIKYHRDDED